MAETIYYLIRERTLGKKEDNGFFIYKDQEWVPDVRHEIQDLLMGYDPYDDTPYGFGSLSIMDEIEEITGEQAMAFMSGGYAYEHRNKYQAIP